MTLSGSRDNVPALARNRDGCSCIGNESVCLLVNYVLSDPYVDVALVGVREPRFVEINNAISDDAVSQLDLAQLHDRYVR